MKQLSEGYTIEPNFTSHEQINTLLAEIEQYTYQYNTHQHSIRNAQYKIKGILALINSKQLLAKAQSYFAGKPKVVRVILFDKTPDKNWLVSWHQDKTISVNKKVNMDNWGPWSVKDETHHVQPQESILNNMVAFRLHLDDANKYNGCLKVIPKSHAFGVLPHHSISAVVNNSHRVNCEVNAGDLMIMKPLLIHSSSKAKQPSHRRVIHIELSDITLPNNLDWA